MPLYIYEKKKILINSGNHTEDLFQKARLGDQELFDIWHEWGSELFFFFADKTKKKEFKELPLSNFFFSSWALLLEENKAARMSASQISTDGSVKVMG